MSTPHRRHLTALGTVAARLTVRLSPKAARRPDDEPRDWQILHRRPGQVAGEIRLFAGLVVFLTLPVTLDTAVRLLDIRGWHWLWFLPLAPVVYLVALHFLILVSAWLGDLAAAAGVARSARPRRRTGFFVITLLSLTAAWAAGTGRWIAVPATAWLVAVALNVTAAVWLSMKASERRHTAA